MRDQLVILALCVLATVTAPSRVAAQTPPFDCKPWGNKPSLGTVCTLAHDDTVFGRRMPAGTQLHYDERHVLDFFVYRKPAPLDLLELQGTPTGPFHFLYPDGTPRQLWLSRTQEVQGVPCRPMAFWTEMIRHTSAVFFHPSGRFKACRLGRAVTIQGVSFDKGDRVEFDVAGTLVKVAR